MLATNFDSLCPKVTNFGSQNFGYQIWFCTRLLDHDIGTTKNDDIKSFVKSMLSDKKWKNIFSLFRCFATGVPSLTWIKYNHSMNKQIAYPFPNLNGCTIEAREWIANFIPHFIMDIFIYLCWDYGAHDTICSAIHLPFLAGKLRLVITACDQKHHTQPTTAGCTVMMRSGYNNGGLLRVPRCSVFFMNLLVLLEYTGCYLRYLVFVSNFGMCYNCTVSYHIFPRAYRDMYRSLCIAGIPVCRCIVSALYFTNDYSCRIYSRLNAILQYLQCISNGDTAV